MTAIERFEQDIKTAMVELAIDVAATAKTASTTLEEKVGALRTLAQVYAVLKKHKDGGDDADDGTFNFATGVGAALPEEPQSNVSQIPARRRPG